MTTSAQSVVASNPFLEKLKRLSDSEAFVGIGIIVILSVMLLPMPSGVLDLLLAINLSGGLLILLTTIYTVKPLDFITFPSLLLVTTLFRIALNVASTRLVLLHGNEGTTAAGQIIHAFGNFVVGGNYVVGFVIFIILVLVNFMVITKGTERISEVAARFTLDAMPGKQMSIDADLNTGVIDDREARRRREAIRQEADFYGTMDGASKFVKGDAIAGILITLINILGGLGIGVLQHGMSFTEALENYALLTVGDGLVSQIPAIVISTAAGLLVSRAANEMGMGKALGSQFRMQPRPLAITGITLFLIGLVPGFPAVPLFLVGGALLLLSRWVSGKASSAEVEQGDEIPSSAEAGRDTTELPPPVDTLEFELGYGLIPLVDESQRGDLLPRIKAIRHQLAMEYGIIVPSMHVRDNLQLKPAEYRLLLKGNPIAKGELVLDHYLALGSADVTHTVKGIPTKDPAFELPALWVPESRREEAMRGGYTVIDASSVLATHLTELFKRHADEMLSRQTVQQLLDNLAETQPKLVEELVPSLLSVGCIQKVLQNLIRERISIRDLQTICETLADHATFSKDPEILTEYVRQSLARTITHPYESEDGKLHILSLQQHLEERLSKSIQKTEHGSFLALEPGFLHQLIQITGSEVRRVVSEGYHPIILSSPLVRRHLKRLLERFLPDVIVISHNELIGSFEIQSIGVIRVDHAG